MNGHCLFVVNFILLSTLYGECREFSHSFHTLNTKRTRSVVSCCDVDNIFDNELPNILKVRVPDTPTHSEVKEYIISRLKQLDRSRWDIKLDTFQAETPAPYGSKIKTFTNIIATLDPHISNRLVLSAHYDSKYFQTGTFLGATDSAVPVAMILDLILTLDSKLQKRKVIERSLQVIFFDGEEAFVRWTNTDSIYGSRHLAEEMSKRDGLLSVDGKTGIEAIDLFVLLDLLGSKQPYPKIHKYYSSGEKAFEKLVSIENRLSKADLLEGHSSKYFVNGAVGRIEDDHKPFEERNVPILHLIPLPFPHVWHTERDNLDAIDKEVVGNFKKILMVFIYEYFQLQ